MEEIEKLKDFYDKILFHLPTAEQVDADEDESTDEDFGRLHPKMNDQREKPQANAYNRNKTKSSFFSTKIRPGFEGGSFRRKKSATN
jgi:hypothetical protein